MTEPYTCPRCGTTSHNPHDEAERYCGNCHQYEDDRKNARLDELLTEAQWQASTCWCNKGRCCRVHKSHVMPHLGCVLR